jgi:hypothetical protein
MVYWRWVRDDWHASRARPGRPGLSRGARPILGNMVAADRVMLGRLVAIARPVSREAIIEATRETVLSRFQGLNRRALAVGVQAGGLACAPVSASPASG